jgi:predicted HTH domain antitoxin
MTSQFASITIPESILQAENMDAETFARELCVLAAVKLYELGRLSSGRAIKLAGMSRVEFLLRLKQYRVFPLTAELDDLDQRDVQHLASDLAPRVPGTAAGMITIAPNFDYPLPDDLLAAFEL